MARITFNRISTLINAPVAINGIITQIENAFDRMLARDTTTPNNMTANMDMNSNRILNLPIAVDPAEPMRKAEGQVIIDTANGIIATTAGNVLAAQNAATASAGYRDQSQGYSTQSAGYRDQSNATYNAFRNIYYGSSATVPTTRPDSTAIVNGDLYYNSVANQLYIRSAGNWTAAALATGGALIAANNLSDLTSTATARSNIGLGNVPNSDATNASNITSGILPAARLPAFTGAITTVAGNVATNLSNGVVAFVSMASAAIGTSAEFLSNTASKLLSVSTVWSAAVISPVAFGTPLTLDFNSGINFSSTATSNFTLANPTNPKIGQTGRIILTQDGTGSRLITMGSNWKTPGGVAGTLSTPANSKDAIDYWVESATSIHYSISKAIA